MSKKVFKKREEIEEVGLLLKIANAALTRACTKISNNIGSSNTVIKSLNKVKDDLNKLRSDMDNKIKDDLIDKELLKGFNEKELNNIFYGQDDLIDKALENLNR